MPLLDERTSLSREIAHARVGSHRVPIATGIEECPQWVERGPSRHRVRVDRWLKPRAREPGHRSGNGQGSDARVVLVIEAQHESDCLPTCGKLIRDDLPSGLHPDKACGCFIGGLEALRVSGDPMIIDEVHVEVRHRPSLPR
jgi:hypothetical protein